ncbi:uncharacterized protein LOC123698427 isoform X2 [Colias croceus]|uniref:uncharacterized protein LOC123698427 isoform X2 n=1 Tax=Colias crocea TaxID=72248 RepID=UPI001E27D338|nr:uncharacterized protein LOC123698427 isoform X2 [Colias croceus]
MNELLQKHGCSNVFSVPEGLKELMSDISREVLREQPSRMFDFIANYLSVLLITREHGVMAVKILDDLCDCRPSVSEHLLQLGLPDTQAKELAQIIKEEIEEFEPVEGKEKIKEMQIMKKILTRSALDEAKASQVCQVARNAYRDYWYRKKTLEKSLKNRPEEPWEIAAERTLEIYKRTKPSFTEMNRAAQKIQAAYRGYHLRRNLLSHLKRKPKKAGPKVDLPGPPQDISGSRNIELGPVIKIKVPKDDVHAMFGEHATKKLGLPYDPMLTITHVADDDDVGSVGRLSRISDRPRESRVPSAAPSTISEGIQRLSPAIQPPSKAALTPVELSMHKISFSEVPPEIIPDVTIAEDEVVKTVEPAEEEHEVPEDIPDDQTDGGSVPASGASTAPDTATTTDVEDEGDVMGTDEE